MEHPCVIQPAQHAVWRADRMGKATIFESSRLLVGLNAFEPGQSHALHAHHAMDKFYHVLEGQGVFLLDGRELSMGAGDLLMAPEGVARRAKQRVRASARPCGARPRAVKRPAAIGRRVQGC